MYIGIDEVGRGCVAGPVVAAAVVIDDSFDVLVSYSKLLSAKRREILDITHIRRRKNWVLSESKNGGERD